MPRLQNATFTITQNQIKWLEEQSEKTGLTKVEVVRRAIDAYAEAQEAKEQRRFFSPKQRKDIKHAAQAKGIPEIEIIRQAIDREIRRITAKA